MLHARTETRFGQSILVVGALSLGACSSDPAAISMPLPSTAPGEAALMHMIDAITHRPGAPESKACPVCTIYEDHKAAVVRIHSPTGLGSGVLITDRGHVITNAHVVGDAPNVVIETSQGTFVPASVVRKNVDADLALLKPEAHDVKWSPSHWDHAAPPRVGSTVYIIGHPAGLGWTVTEGLISGTRKAGEAGKIELIQTNAAISPGNSGGPMFDADGRLVGIVSSKLVGTGIESIGFAIPWSVVREFIAKEPLPE